MRAKTRRDTYPEHLAGRRCKFVVIEPEVGGQITCYARTRPANHPPSQVLPMDRDAGSGPTCVCPVAFGAAAAGTGLRLSGRCWPSLARAGDLSDSARRVQELSHADGTNEHENPLPQQRIYPFHQYNAVAARLHFYSVLCQWVKYFAWHCPRGISSAHMVRDTTDGFSLAAGPWMLIRQSGPSRLDAIDSRESNLMFDMWPCHIICMQRDKF